MKRFTRMAALLLFGLMAAVNVSAAKVEKPNNWKWVSMTRTNSSQEALVYNIGHEIFLTTDNTPTEKNIDNAQVWTLNYDKNTTTFACTKDKKDYRVRLDYYKFGMLGTETGVYEKGNKGSTNFTFTSSDNGSYKFTYNKKYFTADIDANKYTSSSTDDAGNDWILLDPNNTDQINGYKNYYAAYATAYAAAKTYKDVAMPATTKAKLTEVLAKETTYENVVVNTEELNNVVAEIKALTYTVNISDNYATVCLDFNAIVPAGVAAYRLDNYDADKGNMTLKKCAEEGEVLPAGQGFVLHTDNAAAADYNFVFADDKTPATIDTNLFSGTTEETTQEDSKYYWVISNHPTTGKIGFFILNDEVKIPAHKAYFAVDRSQVSLSNCSVFNFDNNTTGIHTAAANKNATIVAIYNAAGKQQASLAKGLNIVKMSDGSIKKIMK